MFLHAVQSFIFTEQTPRVTISKLNFDEILLSSLLHISDHCYNTLNPAAILPLPEEEETCNCQTSVGESMFWVNLLEIPLETADLTFFQ